MFAVPLKEWYCLSSNVTEAGEWWRDTSIRFCQLPAPASHGVDTYRTFPQHPIGDAVLNADSLRSGPKRA
jgi:hypothetical protein